MSTWGCVFAETNSNGNKNISSYWLGSERGDTLMHVVPTRGMKRILLFPGCGGWVASFEI